MNSKEIENTIIKKYRKVLYSPFCKAIKEFDMIKENDKIAVCISGGKDSLLVAKMMQEIQKHGTVNFELEFIAMDPGFNKPNRDGLEKNCKLLDIPVVIKNSKIFEIVDEISNKFPCYLCARMRRGFLYNAAEELGCNKIVLGHHFDDVIETTLLNVLYSGNFKTMMPKLKSTNYNDMELLRPMYYVREDDIIKWKNYIKLASMN